MFSPQACWLVWLGCVEWSCTTPLRRPGSPSAFSSLLGSHLPSSTFTSRLARLESQNIYTYSFRNGWPSSGRPSMAGPSWWSPPTTFSRTASCLLGFGRGSRWYRFDANLNQFLWCKNPGWPNGWRGFWCCGDPSSLLDGLGSHCNMASHLPHRWEQKFASADDGVNVVQIYRVEGSS